MTELEVEKALEHMQKAPVDLSSAYNSAVNRIDSQAEGHRNWAHRVLSWLLHARRHLTPMELQQALAVRPGDHHIELKNLPNIVEVMSLCAGLVMLNQESNIVQLVHYTARQFFEKLENQPVWIRSESRNVATICVTYLSFDDFGTGFCSTDEKFEARLQSNVLYDYAARNWGYHAREASIESEQLILNLLESEAKVSACSQAMMASRSSSGYRRTGYSQTMPRPITGVHLAAYFGLTEAMRALLENRHDPNVKDSYGQTPLSWAIENEHEAVVELLLEKDAKMDYQYTPSVSEPCPELNRSLCWI